MAIRVFAGCAIVLSAIFLLVMIPGLDSNTFGSSRVQAVGLGPAAVPYFAGAATLLLAAVMLVQSFVTRPVAGQGDPAEPGEGRDSGSWRSFVIFTAFLLGFVVAMDKVGFLVSAIMFLSATFLFFGRSSRLIALAIAIVVQLGVDFLLRDVFLIPLPGLPGT